MDTLVKVQVAAADGKYLGDDIGGAAITIRDARTQKILAEGITTGTSGPTGVMCSSIQRGQPLPTDDGTSAYTATLTLSAPTQVKVTAYGPLAARGSANTASVTTWVYPGKNITAGNGLLLEMPGLICQIINPPTHTVMTTQTAPFLTFIANVAMMCGCPISVKSGSSDICPGAATQPWDPSDFSVFVTVPMPNGDPEFVQDMSWDSGFGVAGQFLSLPNQFPAGIYQATVCAQQISTGNTGVDMATFIVKAPSAS